MSPLVSLLRGKSWARDTFIISTDNSLLPLQAVADIFASGDFYWAKELPPLVMAEMLDKSLCFGLYQTHRNNAKDTEAEELEFIGMARCITDFTTFVYLTDVWVNPSYQGRGLGSWLIQCVQEVIE
ncbi:Fc.00g010750.m01.CDS01, partial [Cosmosporella sp. VM-42]